MSTRNPTRAGPPPTLIRPPLLDAVPRRIAGFTTRAGGVVEGPWGSMTLAPRAEVGAEALVENWRRALDALGGPGPDRLALLHQVHGARVVEVDRPGGPLAPVARADAAFTLRPDLVLAVRVADCVPVLFGGPGVVGVAHAGWRGTAAGVVPAAVDAICAAAGCAPGELVAAIGPCISGPAYEVGEEVVEALVQAGLSPEEVLHPTPAGSRPHVDLGRAVERQLARAGVARVERVRRCTLSDPDLHSHRRDGPASGRQAGLIARIG